MLVHEVQQREHEFRVPLVRVDVVVNGNQPDTVNTELVNRLANLQMVPSEAAHVLDNHRVHIASLDPLHHVHVARTVKPDTRNAIVTEMRGIGHLVPAGVVLQQHFLIGDRVGFARQFILMAQTFIEGRDFTFRHIANLL